MNNTCELVYILDRSGSMNGLESDTIGGFNSMIESHRKDSISEIVTVALFDDRLEIPFDRLSLDSVPKMTDKIYYTRGSTALFDSVGAMIQRLMNHRRHLSSAEIPEKTIFVITTDGYENASREFSGAALRKLIEGRKEAGWEFLYLGANVDATVEAQHIGIDELHSAQFHADTKGMAANYCAISETVSNFARGKTITKNWAAGIRKDFKSRKSER